MTKKITFLGIETSCDETAASVIRENDNGTADVLSNIVSSQISEHKKFGGVVPELAARAHIENIEYVIKAALEESKISLNEIDGIAATAGPGLIVCLTVGLNIGKTIAAFSNKPFVAVNHLEGHALSPGIENNKGTADVLSNIVSSQISEHKKFGGVVPELAARAHL